MTHFSEETVRAELCGGIGDFILAALSFIGPDVFSLIVPSCDNECGDGLTHRLRLWMPHMRPGSVGSDQLVSKMVQRHPEPETSDGGSGRRVIPSFEYN